MVNRSMLVSDIETHILNRTFYDNKFQEYRGIYLVGDGDAYEEDMVYAGDADTVARLLIGGKFCEGCLIFAAGENEKLKNAPLKKVNLIVVELSLIELYNHLSNTFLQYDRWQKLITASSNKDTRYLLDTFSRQTGLSILMLSTDMRSMIRCLRKDDEELFPENVMEHGTKCREALDYLMEKLEKLGYDTVVNTERYNGYVFALIPISRRNTIQGYLYACSTGRKSTLRNILFSLSQACFELLENDAIFASEADSFQSLALQFLGDQPENMEKLELRLRHLENPPKKFKRSIVIRFVDEDGQVPPVYLQKLRQLFQELHRFFQTDHKALLADSIYIMTSTDKPDAPLKIHEIEGFEAMLEQYHAFAMISNPSARLKGVRILMKQCYQVLPVAAAVRLEDEKQKRCLMYERYAPYYIIHLCQKSAQYEMGTSDIIYLCHPAIRTLTRYDRAYNSNLRDTLFHYLMNDRSIAKTSQHMFIHRNTTIYKLNKIQELILDDLENPYTRHQLILSCMIIRYVEEYLHSPFNLPPINEI